MNKLKTNQLRFVEIYEYLKINSIFSGYFKAETLGICILLPPFEGIILIRNCRQVSNLNYTI